VLVVDDDPDMRGLARATLERAGYAVRIAGEGLSGVLEAARERPDCIVLDVVMPGMGGAEAGSRILEAAPGTRILVVSGSHGAKDAADQLGVSSLGKPYRPEQLLAAIRALIGPA
jgi:DNA-binding response OmpR family regulator